MSGEALPELPAAVPRLERLGLEPSKAFTPASKLARTPSQSRKRCGCLAIRTAPFERYRDRQCHDLRSVTRGDLFTPAAGVDLLFAGRCEVPANAFEKSQFPFLDGRAKSPSMRCFIAKG